MCSHSARGRISLRADDTDILCLTSFCTVLAVSKLMQDRRRMNLVIHISHNTYHPLKIISTVKFLLSPISNIHTYFPFLMKDTINKLLVTNILIPVIILWFRVTSYQCYRSPF